MDWTHVAIFALGIIVGEISFLIALAFCRAAKSGEEEEPAPSSGNRPL